MSRPRRAAAALLAAGAVALGGIVSSAEVATALPLPPKLRWDNVRADGPNDYVAATELRATNTASLSSLGTVTWGADPTGGQPAGCGVHDQRAQVSGQQIAFVPLLACNGPYLVHLHAAGSGLGGADLAAPMTLAVPGAPMPAPDVRQTTATEVLVQWSRQLYPDLVGYRVQPDAGAAAEVGAGTTALAFVVGPGIHRFQVAALRWGKDGPGRGVVASPMSPAGAVTVAAPNPPPGPGGGSPGGGPTGGSGGAGSGGATPVLPKGPTAKATLPGSSGRRSGRTFRSGGVTSPRVPGSPPTTADAGYKDTLPYGASSADGSESASGQRSTGPGRLGTTTRLVDRRTRSKPGMVVPLAVAMVLVAAALHLRWLMARSAAAANEVDGTDGGGGLVVEP
ncbi:MAG: hypothetical protein JWM05_189 [Acidimicrobiales bacterium]|nr:hypothetical protein [Acidimicrobiales bacterium]